MTPQEFNLKFENYIPPRWYGMAIQDSEVIDYLDKEFQKEIAENPENDFEIYQIKMKFHYPCVYTNSPKNPEWERAIIEILKKR